MRPSLAGLLAVSLPLAAAHIARPRPILRRDETAAANDDTIHILGETPKLTVDPNTTKYCSYWIDNSGQEVCEEIPEWWAITMADFIRWVSC